MASNVVFMYVVALSDSGVQVQRLHPGGEVCQLVLHMGLQVGGQNTWLIVWYGRLWSKTSTLRIGFFFRRVLALFFLYGRRHIHCSEVQSKCVWCLTSDRREGVEHQRTEMCDQMGFYAFSSYGWRLVVWKWGKISNKTNMKYKGQHSSNHDLFRQLHTFKTVADRSQDSWRLNKE